MVTLLPRTVRGDLVRVRVRVRARVRARVRVRVRVRVRARVRARVSPAQPECTYVYSRSAHACGE